jgi:hypothetical protein
LKKKRKSAAQPKSKSAAVQQLDAAEAAPEPEAAAVGDVILSPAAPPKKRKAVEKIARAKVPANAAEAPRRSNRQNDEQKTRAEVARVAALLYNPEDSVC